MNWTNHAAVSSGVIKRCSKALGLLCLASVLLSFSAVASVAETPASTAVTKTAWVDDDLQQSLTKEIVDVMQTQHFRKMQLDDSLSSMLLDNYLKALDPNRMIFLQSDINEFNANYRAALDDDLKSGQLVSAEAIHQRYYDRFSSRLQWATQHIELLVKTETFTGEDIIEVLKRIKCKLQ